MSWRLRDLPPGAELEAEIAADPDQRYKLEVIAGHRGAQVVARQRLESGHWVCRLRKD